MGVCVRVRVWRLQKPVVAIETSRENYEWKRHKGKHHQCLCGYCFNIFPDIFSRLPATAQLQSGVSATPSRLISLIFCFIALHIA